MLHKEIFFTAIDDDKEKDYVKNKDNENIMKTIMIKKKIFLMKTLDIYYPALENVTKRLVILLCKKYILLNINVIGVSDDNDQDNDSDSYNDNVNRDKDSDNDNDNDSDNDHANCNYNRKIINLILLKLMILKILLIMI